MTERKSIVGSGKLSEVACPKCGAPFPQEVFMTSRITCVHCGSVFQRDQLVPPKLVVIDGAATGQVAFSYAIVVACFAGSAWGPAHE